MKDYYKYLWLIIALMPIQLLAQGNDEFEKYKKSQKQKFEQYREQKKRNFEEYRRKRNEEFARFIRKDWVRKAPSPVIPRPKETPVPPVVAPINKDKPIETTPKPLPFDEVVTVPRPKPQPKPVEPIEEVPVAPIDPPVSYAHFSFYGTKEKVRFDKSNTLRLPGIDENSIADAWLYLSGKSYTNLIYDCLQIRKRRNLCDWAYLNMLEQMSANVCGKGTNESVLLMAYVYCQSGYKMRLATDGAKLYMMFASNHVIYNWNYYILDGEKYYAYNNATGNVRICNQQYPKEQSMSLTIPNKQDIDIVVSQGSIHQSKGNPEINISIAANKNMLDFYSSYPTSMYGDNLVTRWALYANMPMPINVSDKLYPILRKGIAGKKHLDAVNTILNWVQTGFEYEYDDKVWGHDRAFFPEESLYYPYCDCEDRSILFSRIVRDILGLNVILVYYPGHLATAVRFNENVNGDYIMIDNERYIICDPTYIGAPVGMTMPKMNNMTAKIILLK